MSSPNLAPEGSGSAAASPAIRYTIFTHRQRIFLTILLGITTLASPVTATTYFPILPLLATQFNTTIQAINLTITLYLIFQAISPAIFATLSDTEGRRPVFLVTYTLYFFTSLGLALNQHSYAALLVLRALQSLGASAIIAIAYGVIADVCMPSERGKMLGWVMAATNLGVCIGPILGGSVALNPGGYRWVFWIFVIFGGVTLLAIGWALPETGRNVVGNGSIPTTGWIRRTWWSLLIGSIIKRKGRQNTADLEGSVQDESERPRERSQKGSWFKKIGNPLTCLRMVFFPDSAPVLWMSASFYAVYYCVQTSIPLTYKDIYNFNELEIGFSYLTGGFGVVAAGFVNGKMMDRNYKITAKKIGFTVNKVSGDDLYHFPIERARARSSWILMGIYVCSLVGYGWTLGFHVHESVPLIFQCVIGFLVTCLLQTYSTLLVDIFPQKPSTAAASGNVTRCALSALAVAVMQPLIDALGRGWYFTGLAIVSGVGGALAVWLIQTRGMEWRRKRLKRTGANRDEKQQEKIATSG